MTQEQVNFILGFLTLVIPTGAFIIRDWWRKRRNTVTGSDDLVEAINKTAASLRSARSEIAEIYAAMQSQDETHAMELEDLRMQHKREKERMRKRLQDLERVLTRYDVSFTLQTHPEVKVENLKVTGIENVTDSQRLRSVTPEQAVADMARRLDAQQKGEEK